MNAKGIKFLAALSVAGFLLMTKSSNLPRGIRNNNAGNIERTAIKWNGEVNHDLQTDDRFTQFHDPRFGIRAIAKILLNYEKHHGLNTVAELIGRWAPSVENDTSAYAVHVAKLAGVGVNDPIHVKKHLPALVRGIMYHENGTAAVKEAYTDELINEGISWA